MLGIQTHSKSSLPRPGHVRFALPGYHLDDVADASVSSDIAMLDRYGFAVSGLLNGTATITGTDGDDVIDETGGSDRLA